mgnify:CR=1 FL=1
MTSRTLYIFGDVVMISLIIIVFCTSCFFLIKRWRKDRAIIRNLMSNSTVVPAEIVENEIPVVEIVIQPTVPEIPPTEWRS